MNDCPLNIWTLNELEKLSGVVSYADICDDFVFQINLVFGELFELSISASGSDISDGKIKQLLSSVNLCSDIFPEFELIYLGVVNSWIRGWENLIERLGDHQADFISRDYISIGAELLSVKRMAPESHYNGEVVRRLKFTDGSKLVYKPGFRNAHNILRELIETIRKQDPQILGDWIPEVSVYSTYSFESYIEHCDLDNIKFSPKRIAIQLGEIIGACIAFSGRDMNFENFIVGENGLYCIDSEALFHPAEEVEQENVSSMLKSTGVLPNTIKVDDNSSIETSILKTMYKDLTRIHPEASHDVRFGLRRFLSAYNKCDKDVCCEVIHRFSGFKSRYPVRPTFHYGLALRYAFSPKRFYNNDVRTSIKDTLEKLSSEKLSATKQPDIISIECDMLMLGNIPAFHVPPINSDIYELEDFVMNAEWLYPGASLVLQRKKILSNRETLQLLDKEVEEALEKCEYFEVDK